MSPYAIREAFQLQFLKALAQALNGRPYAVKGGCCLRFFFGSPRLSEDMDFDIQQVSASALQKHVEKIVNQRAFLAHLAHAGVTSIRLQDREAAKQTATTQRWKLALHTQQGEIIHSKIEFSRRSKTPIRYKSGTPSTTILHRYQATAFVSQYYDAEAMLTGKLAALASDSRFALRDLFDLNILIPLMPTPHHSLDKTLLSRSTQKIQGFGYPMFAEQVLPFLEGGLQQLYQHKKAFEELKASILNWLANQAQSS